MRERERERDEKEGNDCGDERQRWRRERVRVKGGKRRHRGAQRARVARGSYFPAFSICKVRRNRHSRSNECLELVGSLPAWERLFSYSLFD